MGRGGQCPDIAAAPLAGKLQKPYRGQQTAAAKTGVDGDERTTFLDGPLSLHDS